MYFFFQICAYNIQIILIKNCHFFQLQTKWKASVVVVHDWNNYRGLTDKYTVKPLYKAHLREPEINVPFMSNCPLYTG